MSCSFCEKFMSTLFFKSFDNLFAIFYYNRFVYLFISLAKRLMTSLPIVKFLSHQDSPNPLLKAKIDMNHAGENYLNVISNYILKKMTLV